MKRTHVTGWADGHLPGETIEAYVPGGPLNGATVDGSNSPGPGHPADLQNQVALRELDEEQRVWNGLSNLCLILTERRLVVASVGGLVAVKPRELLYSSPRGEFRCEWWLNDTSPEAWYRNWLLFFADGRWAGVGTGTRLLRKTVKAAGLSEEFTAALGVAAVEIDWRDPPSP